MSSVVIILEDIWKYICKTYSK